MKFAWQDTKFDRQCLMSTWFCLWKRTCSLYIVSRPACALICSGRLLLCKNDRKSGRNPLAIHWFNIECWLDFVLKVVQLACPFIVFLLIAALVWWLSPWGSPATLLRHRTCLSCSALCCHPIGLCQPRAGWNIPRLFISMCFQRLGCSVKQCNQTNDCFAKLCHSRLALNLVDFEQVQQVSLMQRSVDHADIPPTLWAIRFPRTITYM